MKKMKDQFKRIFKRILDPDTVLRRRLFHLLSTIALAEFVFVSLYTIVAGGGGLHIALMLTGTVLFALTVAATFKTGRMRVGSAVSGLLYFTMYPLTFFSSGGMHGGAPTVFAFALVYVFLVTQQFERILCLALCICGSAACYVLSYFHPEWLTVHTKEEEYAESFLSILLVTLLLCALFAFVTEVYKAENRIVQRQKKEIEDLNNRQKRFFSSMSHEIRTPLNAIVALNESTLREQIPAEVRENAENIEAASRILLHTVNEILDLSKLETGRMEIRPAEYRTTAMLSEIVSMVRYRAKEKGLDFIIEADRDLPCVLFGDEMRVKQVLLNVVANAVKYTNRGSVILRVTSRKEADGVIMIYEVIDTGIGIRTEDIPHLFTAFQRIDEKNTHKIEGTGLGLFIVRQLLDLMGGTVEVESEYGRGSTFRIGIPQKVVDSAGIGEFSVRTDVHPSGPSENEAPKSAVKVLAVDDTRMNLTVIAKLLKNTGCALDCASSGAEALEKTLQTHYDVILMDHQMPGMDGIECLKRIRAQEDGLCRNSRIVCLTANAGAGMEEQYKSEGFDGYIAKPVRSATLCKELSRQTGEQ